MQNLSITLIQTPLRWENKQKNLELFSQKLDAVKHPTDIIVLPEMFTTGFTMNAKAMSEDMSGNTVNWLKQKAKEKNAVITGSAIIEESGKYYNRLLWVTPEGECQTYDKRHLFRMANEQDHYTEGKKKLIVEIKGWKVCPLVCYDLRFPVWSRNQLAVGSRREAGKIISEYDLLIYVANWPERRSHAWKSLLVARAIENQCYVVGVNRVGKDGKDISYAGDSVVLNAKGEAISKLKANEENIETLSLSYDELAEFRKSFPVGLDADEFSIGN